MAKEAIQMGAQDYLFKNYLNGPLLNKSILQSIERLKIYKQLNQQKTELENIFYILAHDIKSPLSNIHTLTKYLLKESKAFNATESIELINSASKKSLKRIKDIVEQYQDHQRKSSLFFVKSVYEDVISLLRLHKNYNKINFVTQIDPQLESILERPSLSTILHNLIINAINHHNYEQEERFIITSASIENDVFHLKVKDNGKGMTEEEKQKVFGQFYKNASSDGMGLGLFIVKSEVDKNNGQIIIETAPGEGTEITLEFPLKK